MGKINTKLLNVRLEEKGFQPESFPYTEKTLTSLEELQDAGVKDTKTITKVLNLPDWQQDGIIAVLQVRPDIDLTNMLHSGLEPAQFDLRKDISVYNYNIEYGHLKDTGKPTVDTQLISNQALSANQLYYISAATTEKLIPERLFEADQALSEAEMQSLLIEQRQSNIEYKSRLAEVGVNAARLTTDDNKSLFGLYLDGKENTQAANRFNAIINDRFFQFPEHRSSLISNTNFEPENINEKQQNVFNRLKNVVKSFFTLDQPLNQESSFTQTQNHPSAPKHLIDEVNGLPIQQVQIGETTYFEDRTQSLKIHGDNIEVAKLSPNAVEHAIMVAAVKFGVPLVVEGSQEFKEAVVNAIAANEKLSGIQLEGELQQLVEAKQSELTNLDEVNTISGSSLAKTYEQYNTAEKYIEQSGKAYALEYPASGEPHYIAVDNKEEILQFLKVSKDELSEEARQSYENDTLEEFATRYAPDNTYGDLPAVHDKTTLQEQLDNPRLPEGIINSNNWQVGTANWFPENNAHEVYHTGEECIENSNKNFVVAYETKSELGEIFVAVDSKQELGNYLRDVYPDVDLSDAQEYHNSYSNDSFEDFSIVASKAYGMEQTASYEMDELAQEMENDGGMER